MKRFIGYILWKILERHRERALNMPCPDQDSQDRCYNYFRYGLNEFEFNVIYENTQYKDPMDPNKRWKIHIEFFKRIYEKLNHPFFKKINILLG